MRTTEMFDVMCISNFCTALRCPYFDFSVFENVLSLITGSSRLSGFVQFDLRLDRSHVEICSRS